ncbi:MAG: hypothetical protein IH604_10665 [Burkholderiales bacterium]|nr:hypothetical protein [Burkholderiales bacterium]
MSIRRFVVFGLQGSGKTTFAAALWHLLDSREVPTALAKGSHTGNYRYLEAIAQLWCEGWQVERTKSEEVEDVRINLKHPTEGTELALEFTDLAGESFEKAFATRLCDEALVKIVDEAEGMLLFVSAQRMVDDVTILEAFGDGRDGEDGPASEPGNCGAADGEAVNAGLATDMPRPAVEIPENQAAGEVVPGDDDEEWDLTTTPHQVQLVDLLQALQQPPFEARQLKIAVVISAWDLSDGAAPDIWFARRFPLLDQYLRNPQGALELRVYGISAQGGELSQKGSPAAPDRDRLISIVPASNRIIIAGPNVAEHDITRPLYWLSGMEVGA